MASTPNASSPGNTTTYRFHDRTGGAATVAVLLAAAVAGLRAGGAFSHAPRPAAAGFSGSVLVTVLTAGEGVALVAVIAVLLMARPQRRPRQAEEPWRPPIPWWAKTLGALVSMFAVATPLALLIARKGRHQAARAPFLVHPGVPLGKSGHPVTPPGGGTWPVIAGIALAIAVVVTVSLRSRPARAGRPRRRAAGLPESLEAARAALEAGRTPREAIIGCYAAMERGFAAAGSAPAAADTPAEVLTRATEAGLVRSANADMLTGLFRRARYSAEPVTGADSAAAAAALAQMQAELPDQGART
jgi:hypothetical protein